MGLLAWLRRIFGGTAPAQPAPGARDTPEIDRSLAAAGLSMPQSVPATEVLAAVARLRQQSASWPAILAALNPDGDPGVQRLLEEIRAPHLFAPHIGLNVLEAGCRRALAIDPAADRTAGLQTAVGDSSRIVGQG